MPHGFDHREQTTSALMALLAGLNQGMNPSQAAPVLFDVLGQQRAAEEQHRDLIQERQERMRAMRQEKISGLSDLVLERARAGTPWDAIQPELQAVMEAVKTGPGIRRQVGRVADRAFPMEQPSRRTPEGDVQLGLATRAQVSPIAPSQPTGLDDDDRSELRSSVVESLEAGMSPQEARLRLVFDLSDLYEQNRQAVDEEFERALQFFRKLQSLGGSAEEGQTVGGSAASPGNFYQRGTDLYEQNLRQQRWPDFINQLQQQMARR